MKQITCDYCHFYRKCKELRNGLFQCNECANPKPPPKTTIKPGEIGPDTKFGILRARRTK